VTADQQIQNVSVPTLLEEASTPVPLPLRARSPFRRSAPNPLAGADNESRAAAKGMDRIIGSKYKLGRKIGSGSFGEIYLGSASLPRLISAPPASCFRFMFGSNEVFDCVVLSKQRRTSTPTRSSPSRL
jgi:hypothetical protein